jgi:hypothetical protein
MRHVDSILAKNVHLNGCVRRLKKMLEVRPIDANAFAEQYGNYYAEEGPEEGFIGTVGELIAKQPTIEADIDRAEIMRLCNEIEDIVSEISKLSENYFIYTGCKSILDRTKAIGKELTGDAGTN